MQKWNRLNGICFKFLQIVTDNLPGFRLGRRYDYLNVKMLTCDKRLAQGTRLEGRVKRMDLIIHSHLSMV